MSELSLDDRRTRLKRWLTCGEMKLFPLSFPQRELWETAAVPVADVANNISCLIRICGLITEANISAAMQLVVDRHEVLRLSFLPGKDGMLQMVQARGVPVMRFLELGTDEVEVLAREAASVPFDLVKGPLYRLEMLRNSATDHVLVLTIHHAIADGWSLGVFVQDLYSAYAKVVMKEPGSLPLMPLGYTAWAAAERAIWSADGLAKRAVFWKARLAKVPRLWDDRPVAEDGLQRRVTMLPPELGLALRDLGRRHGATLFSTLLAVFQLALSRWTGSKDIVVGTPVANRSRNEVRETMGYFSSVVPLRGCVDGERTFAAALRLVQSETLDCLANAMPFVELVKALGVSQVRGRNPVYEVRFALQNQPLPKLDVAGFSAELLVRSTGTPRFELACEITEEGDGLEVVWLFRGSRFSLAAINDLDCLFHELLSGVCGSPDRLVSNFIQ